MPDFTGTLQYGQNKGAVEAEGPFRAEFDAQTLSVVPAGGASAILCDLGDIESLTCADWEIRATIYPGHTLLLRQLGKAYETVAHDLAAAYRDRSVQCLLLEDLEEIDRYQGTFELAAAGAAPQLGTAELRLYRSNLAVLPGASRPFQWRLAEVEGVEFDASAYAVTLIRGGDRLKFTRLAKRTEELAVKVRQAIQDIAALGARALHGAFPFLDAGQLRRVQDLLREGATAPVAELQGVHPQIEAALTANAVDDTLRPYYQALAERSARDSIFAGYKIIRPEAHSKGRETDDARETDPEDVLPGDADPAGPESLYWFFFVLARPGSVEPSKIVAWEAASRGGRATYFFRLPSTGTERREVASGVRQLSRALGLLNFRRRPIHLSDDELARDPRFRRYAIAARRMPEVQAMRASFLGRASHASLEAWKNQVESVLGRAGA